MRRAVASFFALAASLAGCVSPEGSLDVDAGPGYRRDGAPVPIFRRCGGDGGAISDAACGDGEVPTPIEDAGPPPPPCNEVTFSLFAPDATSVWLSGSFLARPDGAWPTNPSEGALVLERDDAGRWSVTTRVEPIGRHLYKFIIDGSRWIHDPANDAREPDGFGGFNSVIDVCTTSCGDLDQLDWRNLVMYFVMVDRFRDADGRRDPVAGVSDGPLASGQYMGGDLRGVTERLPYLAELGVTAIWLSAPYDNRDLAGAAIDPGSDPHTYSGYHGYWPSPPDVRYAGPGTLAPGSPRPRVESRIGDELDLHMLVDTAHATMGANGHGIRVLFDYVMNHVDSESALFRARDREGWFARDPSMGNRIRLCGPENLWEDPYWGTRCAFTDYLPPFDFERPEPRAWSIADAIWWAREYGIDGYRLDAIKHVPLVWLTDLRRALRAAFPDPAGGRFYLVGETYNWDNRDLLRSFVDPDTMLDGQFDFPFRARACEALLLRTMPLSNFAAWMDGNDGYYGNGALMSTWIGNHDIPRAIHFATGQITDCRAGSHPGNGWTPAAFTQPSDAAPYERLALAFVVMMTNPGVPLIYYGDEIGLAGGGDPDNRRPMIWDDRLLNSHQIRLRDVVSTLGQIRGRNGVLGRGRRVTVSVDADTWVYRMTGCESAGGRDVTVAINRADSPRTVVIPEGGYEDLVTGGSASGGAIELPARGFRILRAR
jgi:glycosidase